MEAVTSAAAPTAGRFDEHSYLESGFPVRAFMAEPAYLDVLNISSIGSSIPAVGGPTQPRPTHQHTNSSSSSGELAQLQKQMMLEMTGGTSCNQQQQRHLVQTGIACVVAGSGNLDHFQASHHQQDRGSSHDGSVVQLGGGPGGAADGKNPVQPQHVEEDTLASAMAAAAAATAASADAPASAAEDVSDKCNTDGLADRTAAAAAADVHAPAVQPNATGACHTAVQGHTLTINPAAATAAAAAAAATGHPATGLKVDITSPGVAVTTPGFRSLQGLVSPGTEELQGCCAALMMLRDLQHPDSAAAAEIKELVPKAYAPGSRGGFRVGAAAVTAAAAARASGYLGQSSSNAGTNGAAAAGSGRLPGLAAAAGVKAGGIQGTAADQEALQDDQVAEQEQQLQLALRRGKRQRKPQRWGEQLLMLDQLVDDVVAESHSSGGFRDWEQRHVTWQQPLPQAEVGVGDPALAAAEGPEDDAGDASYDAAADGDAEMLDYEQEMEIDEEGASHHFRRSSSHRGAKKVTGGDSSASGDYHPATGGGSTAKSGRRRKRGSSGSGGGARLPKARKIRKGAKPLYDNDGAVNDSTAREHSTVSSYLGVSKKRTGKWQAAVRFGHDGAYAFWCCYNCPKTAARARDAAALALRGPGSARLNFPEDSYSDDELLAAAAQILAKHPHLHSHLGHPLVAGMSLSQVLAAGGLAAAAAAAAVEEDEVAAAAAAVAAAETGEVVNAGRIKAAADGIDDGETGATSAEAAAELAAAVAAAAMAMADEETAAAVAEAAAITSEAAGTGAAKQQLQPRRTSRRSAARKSKDLTELAATEAEVEAAMQPPAEIVVAAAAPVAPAHLVPVAEPPVMIATRDTAALFSRVFDLAALVVFGAEAATEIPATAFSNEELAAAAAAMSCRMPLALQQQQLQQQLDACQQQQQQQQGLTMGTKEEEQQQTTDSEEKAVCIVTTPSVVKGGAADGSSTAGKQQKGVQRAVAAADQDAPPMAVGSSEQEWQQQQQLDCSKQQHSSVDEAVAAAAKPAATRALTGHQQYTGCGNLELQQPQLRTAATAGC